MSFLQRIKSAITRAPGSSGGLSGGIQASLVRDGAYDAPKTPREILEFYSKSPPLHAVARKIAHLVASQTWRLYVVEGNSEARTSAIRSLRSPDARLRRATRDALRLAVRKGSGQYAGLELREVPAHPFLTLLDAPNESMLGLQVRMLQQIYMDLVGECFMLLERDGLGAPTGWLPLNPIDVERLPIPGDPFYRVNVPRGFTLVPVENMFYLREIDPSRPFGRGSSHGRVLGDEIETHEYATKYLKNHFRDGAVPPLVVSSPQMTAAQARRNEARWLDRLRGFRKRAMPWFMEAPDGSSIQQLDTAFKHGGVVELKAHERDFILQVFGLPPEVLGILTNSNRATSLEARQILAENVICPRMEVWRSAYQARLLPMFGDRSGLIVDYDDPSPEDRDRKLKAAQQSPFALTIDEHRMLIGEEPLDSEDGKLFPVPSKIRFVESLGDLVGEEIPPAGTAPMEAPSDDAGEMEEMPEAESASRRVQRLAPEEDPMLVALDREVERATPALIAAYGAALDDWREQVSVEDVERMIQQQGELGFDDALAFAILLSLLQRSHEPVVMDALDRSTNAARRVLAVALGLQERIETVRPIAAGMLLARTAEIIRDLLDTTRRGVRQLLAEAWAGGISPLEAARRIVSEAGLTERQAAALARKAERWAAEGIAADRVATLRAREARRMLLWRLRMIARTELRYAAELGQHQATLRAFERNELPQGSMRVWRHRKSDVPCPICIGMLGQRRGINERFVSSFNGVSYLHPPAHPACHCSVSLVVPAN